MIDTASRHAGFPAALSNVPWVWLDGLQDRNQTTLLARCQRVLDKVPRHATIRLATNHLYRLYVNGRLIGRGPARSDPRWPLYDSYDVADLLRRDQNVIVVLAHHFNWKPAESAGAVHRSWCLYNGPGGLWASLEVDGQSIQLAGSWEARLAPGWDDAAERIGRFLAYQHHVDLSAFEPVMQEVLEGRQTDSASWRPMTVQSSQELGQPAPRPTPELLETVREPLRIGLIKTSDAAVANVPAVQRDEHAQPITIADSHPSWLSFDFGRPMGGFPELELECQGKAEIDLYMGEGAQSRRTDRVRCAAGRWCYEPIDWRGGRTIHLHVRPSGGPVVIHAVRMIERVYPFRPVGDFACSDATLTALWQVCRQATWAAVKDHPVDCLAREQAMWIADINVHSRAIHAAFGDLRPVEKAIRQSLQVMHEDGVVPVPGPVGLGYKRTDKSLPWSEQPLTVSMTLRDHYWHTGSLELAREAIDRLETMYRHFERYEDGRGLLAVAPPGFPALVAFGGWNPFFKRGVPAALNFEYVRSLEAAADLAEVTGRVELVEPWRRRAARARAAAVTVFWNPAHSLFVDAEHDGGLIDAYSPTVNAWAALAGAVPPDQRGSWAEAVRSDFAVMPPVTPYDATLLLEAFAVMGLDLHARELLDRYFGSIVRAGEPTLPEFWIAAEENGASRGDDSSACHPYGAGPTYLLQEHVLGVTPRTPGFATALIAPRSFGLTDARGRVPTPHGPIAVEWRRGDTTWRLRIELPGGVDAELRLPRLGWVREHLVINGHVAWKAEASAYALQRERQDSTRLPRTIARPLTGGGTYEVELRTS